MAIIDTSVGCMKRVNPEVAGFRRNSLRQLRFLLGWRVVPALWLVFCPNTYKTERECFEAGSCRKKVPRNNKKFMQTLETETYHTISKEASQRGATVQELLRAVIIPEWLSENRKKWSK